jgi:hypothetical protein
MTDLNSGSKVVAGSFLEMSGGKQARWPGKKIGGQS